MSTKLLGLLIFFGIIFISIGGIIYLRSRLKPTKEKGGYYDVGL